MTQHTKPMNKAIIIISSVFGVAIIGLTTFAIFGTSPSTLSTAPSQSSPSSSPQSSSNPQTTSSTSTKIPQADLAKNNGKNGNPCWVAIDGTIYDLTGSNGWRNGIHTQSDGRAYCGVDMSDVIAQSPHGKSVLSRLPIIGEF